MTEPATANAGQGPGHHVGHRVGLVLGAGGTAGAAWIFGCLEVLEELTDFDPGQADVLIGTSIGAIKAASIAADGHVSARTFDALQTMATVPNAPTALNTARAAARLAGGKAVALVARAGAADPLTWVEDLKLDGRAQIVSMQRFPPARRVAVLAESATPEREVAASAAIPFGAKPVEMEGKSHVDGAVWSVTNADLASPEDLDLLIVIAPLVATDGGSTVSSLGRDQLITELEPWHAAGKPVIVLAPSGAQYEHRKDRKRHHADARSLTFSKAPTTTRSPHQPKNRAQPTVPVD